jgi:hypothetical protein
VDDITFEPSPGAVGSSDTPDEKTEQETTETGLASPFLAKIPVQDRAVVARYIKDWDAGVTKKFQEYSGKLKPYEQLGSYEDLQKYYNLANNLRTQPEMVFRLMYQGLQQQYGDDWDNQLRRIVGMEDEVSEEQYYEEEGGEEARPDEIFQQNVMQELEELREWRNQTEQSWQSQQEEQQLNQVLNGLHQQYGDFDDEGVLVRIAAHGDPHKAVKEWRATVARYSQNGSQRQAPKVMGGQGGVPSEQVDTKSLRGSDRKQAVMNALAAIEGN